MRKAILFLIGKLEEIVRVAIAFFRIVAQFGDMKIFG